MIDNKLRMEIFIVADNGEGRVINSFIVHDNFDCPFKLPPLCSGYVYSVERVICDCGGV